MVRKKVYTEKDARNLIAIFLHGLKYIHDHNYGTHLLIPFSIVLSSLNIPVHRDLKPENLLLKSELNDTDIKICDFGFAAYCESYDHSLTEQLGTPNYMAPEMITRKAYGKGVDMWAAGVISFILLEGNYPFSDANQQKLFMKIAKGQFEFRPKYWVDLLMLVLL